MSSVREIARKAGVSIATVSRVLNSRTGVSDTAPDSVMVAINQAGYVPSVGHRSTRSIALVYTGDPSLGSPFDAALLQGIYGAMRQRGFDLMILEAHRSRLPHETFTQMFIRKGVRGVLLRTTLESRAVCQAVGAEEFPAVVIGDRFEHPGLGFIYSDSRVPTRDAVEHLIALGHRRIAICTNVVEDSDHADRAAGYREAHEHHGLAVDPQLVLQLPAYGEGGIQAIRRLLTIVDRPTALVLTDPMTCIGAVSEARRVGLDVPGDLSIVGFDDSEMRHGLIPQLTAVCQNAEALGREAVVMLDNILSAGVAESNRVRKLCCWLEVHDSTDVPRTGVSASAPPSGGA